MAVPTAALKTWWNPAHLNAAIVSAFPQSVAIAVADAKRNAHPSDKAGATGKVTSPTTAYMKPTGLGFVFEQGRRGGYEINPGLVLGLRSSRRRGRTSYTVRFGRTQTQALKFTQGDGGFAARVIGGAMTARPYVGPAAERWARGGYQVVAKRALATKGFGVKL